MTCKAELTLQPCRGNLENPGDMFLHLNKNADTGSDSLESVFFFFLGGGFEGWGGGPVYTQSQNVLFAHPERTQLFGDGSIDFRSV